MTRNLQPLPELKRQLADRAEVVCRRYLSAGDKSGSYWRVGDIDNTPGRSMFVGLAGPHAGHWTDHDAHGDLLDIIVHHEGDFGRACRAARLLLASPEALAAASASREPSNDHLLAARRNFDSARALRGTLGERYLAARGITAPRATRALRFLASTAYRDGERWEHYPALIGAFTDEAGAFLGILRTYLDPARPEKAKVADPRRTLARVGGGAVRFGDTGDTIAVGEGIETMLSVQAAFPKLPVAACSGDKLLSLWRPSPRHHKVLIALDADPAGELAARKLAERLRALDIRVALVRPVGGDFNDDLRALGSRGVRRNLLGTVRALSV